MTREEIAKAYADMICAEYPYEIPTLHSEVRQAYLQGMEDADDKPAWRRCEDEMPTDPHQPYWVYAKCCGECCVAYLQENTNIFYDEGGEELSGVVAWLPLPKFNPTKA